MRIPASLRTRTLVAVGVLCAAVQVAGHADEGFWLFNRLPRAEIRKALGVDLSDAWITRVQQASVRFPSGSGSFVSADGLVLTNHHVAMDIIQELSTTERDFVKEGFLARDQSQELKAPNLELLVLQQIEDVTARVNQGVTTSMSAAEALTSRRAAIAAIEAEAEKQTGLQSEMVTLYQGAQYHLYLYKKLDDVRLVFAPEFDAAFFGGDPDNFTFPRYCLDMTLFRVYEGGRPLRVTHFLPWSRAGVKADEPVFTSGHPGTTQRLNTVAHLEFIRDHGLPFNQEVFGRLHKALSAYRSEGTEQERHSRDLFFSLENSLKAWRGQIQGLRDPGLMAKKIAAEASLRAAVSATPDLARRFGDAWPAVAKGRSELPAYNLDRVFFEGGLALFSEYFTHARTLLRWSEESLKPNGQRLPEYTDTRKAQIERQLGSEAPIFPALERVRLAESLALVRDKLGSDHTLVVALLAGKAPLARASELVETTMLGSAAVRKELFTGGADAVRASKDPFINLARLIEPRARELRKKYDDEVLAVEREAYGRIAQAVFATAGESAYPDATFTLRLSYGAVKRYEDQGRTVEPFTQLRGLFVRADEHGQKPPYKYPERWAKARAALDLTTPYNFVTTNDIVGGNSGSPVINARGELVGLIFDGNIQSLPGSFVYDGTVNRAVAVDVRGMVEALRKVYQAEALVGELLGAAVTVPGH
ncbi:MAG: S46 family peptidase [Acidobacteriota bacterium]